MPVSVGGRVYAVNGDSRVRVSVITRGFPAILGWETGIENASKLEYNNLQSVGTL